MAYAEFIVGLLAAIAGLLSVGSAADPAYLRALRNGREREAKAVRDVLCAALIAYGHDVAAVAFLAAGVHADRDLASWRTHRPLLY